MAAADTAALRRRHEKEHPAGSSMEADIAAADEPSVDLGSFAPGAPVTFRRTKGRDSLKRLSDILSAYIPVRGHDDHQLLHQPLLETDEENIAPESTGLSPKASSRGGYRTFMLLNVASLRADEEFNASSRENLLLDSTGDAQENAEEQNRPLVDGDIVGIAMSNNGLAFLIFKDSPDILRLDTRSKSASSDLLMAKACKILQIRLHGGVKLRPTDVKVYKERLYVCGHLKRKVGDASVPLSAIVRCSFDGVVEQASKELPQPRFLGFDIDPTDDQLVVASPTPDGHGSQIFKMSDDFKRKLFKIQLGTRSWHRPEFVACTNAEGQVPRCWVSMQQSSSPNGLATGQVKHRLLSFPMRRPPPEAAEKQEAAPASTKDWMKVSNWKFEGLQPGRLLALPSPRSSADESAPAGDEAIQRLLTLCRDKGNIYSVSEELGCVALTHPASEGGQSFVAICCLNEQPLMEGARNAGKSKSWVIDIFAATKDSLYLLQAC